MKPTLIILLGFVVVGMLVSLFLPKATKLPSRPVPSAAPRSESLPPVANPAARGDSPVGNSATGPGDWKPLKFRSRLRKGEYAAPPPGQPLGPEWKRPYTEAARAEMEKKIEDALRETGYGAFPRLKLDRHTSQGDVERYFRQFKDRDRVKAMFPVPSTPPK